MRTVLLFLLPASLLAASCSFAGRVSSSQAPLQRVSLGVVVLMVEPRQASRRAAIRFGEGVPGLSPTSSGPAAEQPAVTGASAQTTAATSSEPVPKSRMQTWIMLGVLALMLVLGALVKSRISRGKPKDEPLEESA